MTSEEIAIDYARTECCNSCTDSCKKNKCKMFCNVRNAVLYGLKEKETVIFDKWCRTEGDECQFLEKLEKENEQLKAQIEKMKSDWAEAKKKGLELLNLKTMRIKQLEAQIDKMKSFIHSEIDFCVYCPLTNECRNEDGTCPYACATEDEQKNLLMDFIQKWEKAE